MRAIVCFGTAICLACASAWGVSQLTATKDGSAPQWDLIPPRGSESLLVGSFNLNMFSEKKLDNPRLMQSLAKIIPYFDVIALQDIHLQRPDGLARLVAQINTNGRKFDYIIGPRVGHANPPEQLAFLYDTARVAIVRSSIGTAEDPDNAFYCPPLIASFQARVSPEASFTFSLVNVHGDRNRTEEETTALQRLVTQLRQSRPDEDDLLLLGDFNVSSGHLLAHVGSTDLRPLYETNPRSRRQFHDNVLLSPAATCEFTGRCGLFDLQHELGLTYAEALEVSDHLPVWVELSAYEGLAASSTALKVSPTPR